MSTEIELVDRHQALPGATEWTVMRQMAEAVARTEFVPKGLRGRPDATLAAIMFGREIGLPPMVAMSSVHIIDGHPTMSAPLLLALIRKSGGKLTSTESTTTRAKITARRGDGEEATVEYTIEEAQAAGLTAKDNWRKYPADMLWARCVSRLYRRLFSDAAFGATIYAPEDFDQRDVEADSVFTEDQVAELGVMQGLTEYLPRPPDGKPMADLVKKEVLASVRRVLGQDEIPWADLPEAERDYAIRDAQQTYLEAVAKLGIATPDELTFDQGQAILNLVRDGTLPPDGPEPEQPTIEQAVDEALTEQRWIDLMALLETDLTLGTNGDIEFRTRKLYRLMEELALWPADSLHADLAAEGHQHYSDLGRKVEYQRFARAARQKAQAAVLAEGETP